MTLSAMILADSHMIWMLLLSVLCTGAAISTAYISKWFSTVLGYVALVAAVIAGFAPAEISTLVFWGVASAIAAGISVLLPQKIRDSRVGVSYFCTGALMGMALGMLTDTSAGIITGSAIGVLVGALAFSRADRTNPLEFPSRRFFNYLCAKGLPLIVVMSMAGICILYIVNASKTASF